MPGQAALPHLIDNIGGQVGHAGAHLFRPAFQCRYTDATHLWLQQISHAFARLSQKISRGERPLTLDSLGLNQ